MRCVDFFLGICKCSFAFVRFCLDTKRTKKVKAERFWLKLNCHRAALPNASLGSTFRLAELNFLTPKSLRPEEE